MHLRTFAIVAGALLGAAQAEAAVTLTFEGVGSNASVNDFYNGGTDSQGNSGTNYGISFSSNGLGLTSGNYSNNPSGVTILYFLSGANTTMNVAAGFDTGFSFYYAASSAGSISVYDGLNGTGNVLATLSLAGTPTPYSQWANIGVSFAGIAKSVNFGGSANNVGFDNITLGAAVAAPGNGASAVPEPAAWAMMLGGFGMMGMAMRRSRRTSITFA